MQNKRCYNFLIFACCLVWVIMMGSKNIYTAEYIEIGRLFGVSKPQASLAMTFYFITYGIMQIFLFFILDNLNIKWYMLISVALSGIVTIFIALAMNLWSLWWILAINGILQAGIWGMCTHVLNKYLPLSMKATANMIMNIGTAIAGIISYGSASLFISFKRFDSPFTFFGVILFISAIIFFIAVTKCEKLSSKTAISNDTATIKTLTHTPFTLKNKNTKILFFIITFLLSFLIHCVFYGTINWLPSLVQENFGVKEQPAVLISVLAPLATTIGPIIAIKNCEKHINFVAVGFIYLVFASILSLLFVFIFNLNIVLSLAVLIIYLIIIQGAVTIVFSVISYKLCDYINAGAHSGLMNAAGSFSAGIAPTITGAIIQYCGWQISYAFIFILTLFITIFIGILLLLLNKTKKQTI
ncbi:MAG: MFS transporter [Clostridiales bacterium]|nr:MFS transporter [Clostridiales bacterium]